MISRYRSIREDKNCSDTITQKRRSKSTLWNKYYPLYSQNHVVICGSIVSDWSHFDCSRLKSRHIQVGYFCIIFPKLLGWNVYRCHSQITQFHSNRTIEDGAAGSTQLETIDILVIFLQILDNKCNSRKKYTLRWNSEKSDIAHLGNTWIKLIYFRLIFLDANDWSCGNWKTGISHSVIAILQYL